MIWRDRAHRELAATGARPIRRDDPASDSLTGRELAVARVVAGGATNKEAGAQMFLSEKTIEYHLRNTYRKLGIRNRSQLAVHMTRIERHAQSGGRAGDPDLGATA